MPPAATKSVLERLTAMLVVPAVLAIVAVGFAGVCLRYVLGGAYALFWTEEVIRYGFIWVFWLTAPLLLWSNVAFSVDSVREWLPPRPRVALIMAGSLCMCALLVVYAIYGVIMARLNWSQLSTALEIPMGWAYLPIPIGAAAMLAVLLWQMFLLLSGRSVTSRKTETSL